MLEEKKKRQDRVISVDGGSRGHQGLVNDIRPRGEKDKGKSGLNVRRKR